METDTTTGLRDTCPTCGGPVTPSTVCVCGLARDYHPPTRISPPVTHEYERRYVATDTVVERNDSPEALASVALGRIKAIAAHFKDESKTGLRSSMQAVHEIAEHAYRPEDHGFYRVVPATTPVAVVSSSLDVELFFEPCRDFAAPASCYTNDGTGLWCDPCLARRDLLLAHTSSQAAGLDVERLANMREVISGWLDAERLLDTMTVDDGPALQDAWDAVHFTREQVAAEYALLAASPDDGSGSQDGLRHQHRWPVLPNPTCMWIGCPGNEIEDFHEHCADCGAINPDSIYEDDDGQHHRYRLATTQGQPPVTGVDGLDAARMTHAWSILTAETNPDRWEPDRYNAAAFVKALLDKYEWLATATLADLAPKYAARLTSTVVPDDKDEQ